MSRATQKLYFVGVQRRLISFYPSASHNQTITPNSYEQQNLRFNYATMDYDNGSADGDFRIAGHRLSLSLSSNGRIVFHYHGTDNIDIRMADEEP